MGGGTGERGVQYHATPSLGLLGAAHGSPRAREDVPLDPNLPRPRKGCITGGGGFFSGKARPRQSNTRPRGYRSALDASPSSLRSRRSALNAPLSTLRPRRSALDAETSTPAPTADPRKTERRKRKETSIVAGERKGRRKCLRVSRTRRRTDR